MDTGIMSLGPHHEFFTAVLQLPVLDVIDISLKLLGYIHSVLVK